MDRPRTQGISLSDFNAGEARPFKTHFPYVPEIKEYQAQIKIADSTPWRFDQEGSYARENFPFDVYIGTSHHLSEPVRRGSTIQIILLLTNTSDHEIKVIFSPWVTKLLEHRVLKTFEGQWKNVQGGCGSNCKDCGVKISEKVMFGRKAVIEYACGLLPSDSSEYHRRKEMFVSFAGTVH